MDIAAWLRDLRLERYEQAFRENEIDAEILPKLTADDLKDIGVTTVGHRRKLLEAIAALAEPASAPWAAWRCATMLLRSRFDVSRWSSTATFRNAIR